MQVFFNKYFQRPWADFKSITLCCFSYIRKKNFNMKAFYFPNIYNASIFLPVVAF